jgi:hypothetical protein
MFWYIFRYLVIMYPVVFIDIFFASLFFFYQKSLEDLLMFILHVPVSRCICI